jgi:hypothetical protein
LFDWANRSKSKLSRFRQLIQFSFQLIDIWRPLRCDDAEFCQVRSDRIADLRALASQKVPRAVKNHDRCVGLALDGGKPDGGPRHGFADGRRVCGIGHLWLHIGRRHQPDVMPHIRKPASPVVSTCADLHADQASWMLLEKRKQLAAAKLAARENSTVLVYTMDLEDALCEVDNNCGKL